jgi:hypothetical protein
MQLTRYLEAPYRLARLPLATVDARLPHQSPVRAVTATALSLSDRIAAQLLGVDVVTPDMTASPASPAAPATETPVGAAPADRAQRPSDVEEEREADLEAARKRMEHTATRANKNLSTIRRDVARTEAVVDAREARPPQS